jgi:hypothetical protein
MTMLARRSAEDGDFLVNSSRRLVFLGMILLPMLSIRVAKGLDVSDAVFALSAVTLLMSQKVMKVHSTPVWYVGGFLIFVGGIGATFVADSFIGSLIVVFNGAFVIFVWQWTLRHVLTTSQWRHMAMTAYVLGSTISAFVAFIQTEFHTLGYRGAGGGSEGSRAVGLTGQPDIAAVTYALSLVFAIGLLLHLGRGRYYFRVICVVIIATALIFSASVSGMAGTLLGIFILLLKRGLKPSAILGTAAILALVFIGATSLLGSGKGGENLNPIARLEQTTSSSSSYNTVNSREATWSNAWKGIQESPVWGHGLDAKSVLVYYDPYLFVSYPAHNILLCIWYIGGLWFVIGYAICFGSAFARLSKKGNPDPIKDIIFSGAIAVLVFTLVSPELFDRWLWLPFVLAMTFPPVTAKAKERPYSRLKLAGRASGAPPLGTPASLP